MFIDLIDNEEVIAFVSMTLISAPQPYKVSTDLKYFIKDPYAVTLVFNSGTKNSTDWVFARELLIDGLLGSSGIGDIHIEKLNEDVLIKLSSPEGKADLTVTRRELLKFTDRTLELVPLGSESSFMNFELSDFDIKMLSPRYNFKKL